MKATIRNIAALAILSALVAPAELRAQDDADVLWTGGEGGNWTDNSWNTSPDSSPPNPLLGDVRAIIGTGIGSGSPVGVVNVSSDLRVSNPSPEVRLGDGAGYSGTLNITPNGKLKVVPVVVFPVADSTDGNFDTGFSGGTGLLNVEGTLEIAGQLNALNVANAASTVTLSGSASVTAGSGFLDRNFIVDGANVSASFTGNLVLGSDGTHTWKIPAGGASTIEVGGDADLGGTLQIEFPDGTPAMGSSWNLIDSATVDATSPKGFNNIVYSPLLGLGTGSTFAVSSVAGSPKGQYTQLALEQHPVLVVDRTTGAASLQNFHPSVTTVDFQAYVIGSARGALNQAGWSSIAPANGWVEANPSSTLLSELNPISSESIAASGSIPLGTPVVLPAPLVFGEDNEDITFQFGKTGESVITEGRVIYTGPSNSTLTLNVDPITGAAQIVNGTDFTVSMQTYVIATEDGSFNFADGNPADTWNSLEDQGASDGNWFEANPIAKRISELLAVGGLELAPDATVDLGSPFKANDPVNGVKDLDFQFALVGGDTPGDFDQDGDVDGADLLVWQRGEVSSPPSASDLADWQQGFGTSSVPVPGNVMLTGKVLYGPLVVLGGGSVAAVPEPSTLGLMGACFTLLFGAARRRIARIG